MFSFILLNSSMIFIYNFFKFMSSMILVKSFVKLISRNFPGSLASLRLCIEIPFLLQYLHIKTKLEVATLPQFFF